MNDITDGSHGAGKTTRLVKETEKFNVDHARMDIIGKMNLYGDEFPELKNELFYYNKKLKCFTSKKK
jgi:hypothetical protein